MIGQVADAGEEAESVSLGCPLACARHRNGDVVGETAVERPRRRGAQTPDADARRAIVQQPIAVVVEAGRQLYGYPSEALTDRRS